MRFFGLLIAKEKKKKNYHFLPGQHRIMLFKFLIIMKLSLIFILLAVLQTHAAYSRKARLP
jgi:hypothetical protein